MTNSTPRASVLAIGTELTSGQVTNRNAAWISGRLDLLGIETALHETVPDDRELIRESLDRCATVSRLIFVTGGLGPTSDDFTRDVIAQWAGRPMQFDEASWKHIHDRLSRFGVKVAESNRQQCYFPEGSVVLPNAAGTANGFRFEKDGCTVWVLPGPPREIAAIWESGVTGISGFDEQIRERAPGARRAELLTWQCIGKSEAELGEITEKAVEGSGLLTGYRAHRPFVEVKLWVPQGERAKHAETVARLENAIAPWVATRQGEDLAELLLAELSRFEQTEILDLASGGVLGERLGPALRDPARREFAETVTLATQWTRSETPIETVRGALAIADAAEVALCVAGVTDGGDWAIGMREGDRVHAETRVAPYRIETQEPRARRELLDRNLRVVAELALKQWRDWLREGVN